MYRLGLQRNSRNTPHKSVYNYGNWSISFQEQVDMVYTN